MPTFLPEGGGNHGMGMAATLAATTWCREDGDENGVQSHRASLCLQTCARCRSRSTASVVVAQMFRLDKRYIRSPFRVGFTV